MASIQQRVSAKGVATWRVGWRENGKLVWSPAFTDPEGAVETKLNVERIGPQAAMAIVYANAGGHSTATLAQRFERHLELLSASVEPATIKGYRSEASRTWLPRLGDMPLDSITREMVIDWIAWQRRQETQRSITKREKAARAGTEVPEPQLTSPKTIRNAHGLLSAVLGKAVDAGLLERNVAHGIALPKSSTDSEKEIFTENEFVRFYDAVPEHYRPLTMFLIDSMARFGEATAVQVKDFDLDAAVPYVRIERAWKKGVATPVLGSTKSRRSKRSITLSKITVDLVRPLLEGKDADEFVFTSAQGKRIQNSHYRERVWDRALTKAGITKHLTPHQARHTGASWLLMGNVPTQVVQDRLGHESIHTTSTVYAHILVGAQAIAAGVMQAALGGAEPEALPMIEGSSGA